MHRFSPGADTRSQRLAARRLSLGVQSSALSSTSFLKLNFSLPLSLSLSLSLPLSLSESHRSLRAVFISAFSVQSRLDIWRSGRSLTQFTSGNFNATDASSRPAGRSRSNYWCPRHTDLSGNIDVEVEMNVHLRALQEGQGWVLRNEMCNSVTRWIFYAPLNIWQINEWRHTPMLILTPTEQTDCANCCMRITVRLWVWKWFKVKKA